MATTSSLVSVHGKIKISIESRLINRVTHFHTLLEQVPVYLLLLSFCFSIKNVFCFAV